MTRNQFFTALLTAPFAALAAAKVKPVASSEIAVKLTCDTQKLQMALASLSKDLAMVERSTRMCGTGTKLA
jgi:hypothetical protein